MKWTHEKFPEFPTHVNDVIHDLNPNIQIKSNGKSGSWIVISSSSL